MEAEYTPEQRAERIVNRWCDYLGCGASEEYSTVEWQALRRIIAEEIHAQSDAREMRVAPC